MLLLSELESAELWVCERVYQPVGTTLSAFVIQLRTCGDAKSTVLWARPQNEPCAPDFPVHTR